MTYTQLSLFDVVSTSKPAPKCHFKGCKEPVVGSSSQRGKYVCDHHNDLEWATALAHGKDGYWKKFGQRWLAELEALA